jgi:hypothetical protein
MAMGFDNQGHIGGGTDGVWAKDDPALRVSFGYASEHALAQAAKAIITAYYGKPPAYSAGPRSRAMAGVSSVRAAPGPPATPLLRQ